MLLDSLTKKIATMAIACLIVSPAAAQETNSSAPQPATATLTADGALAGNVATASADKIETVPNAKVSLVSQGKVIDSVTADAAGQFSFASVHPGPYQIVGAAEGLVGSQAVQVAPFAQTQQQPLGQIMLQQPVATGSYSMAPVTTYSTSPAVSYGGGGRAIGGRLGGRLGRGFLRSPRGLLVAGGIVGGAVAIADSSPDH